MLNMGAFHINKRLLAIKGYFFLFNAGTAPVIPYLSIYAKQLGFSSLIVGIIYTILPFVGMLSKPIAGVFADRFHCQKIIFLIAGLVVAAGFTSIYFVPEMPEERLVHVSCDGYAVFDTCVHNKSLENVNLQLNENEVAICELNCPLEADEWNTVCKHWNATTYCSKNPDIFNFKASVPLERAVLTGSCVYFKIGNVTLEDGSVVMPSCPTSNDRISSICRIDCNNVRVNELTTMHIMSDNEVLKSYQFWVFLLLMAISWIAMAIVVSVGDTICFELLGDRPSDYGAQRCFGALGWGVLTIITGLLINSISKDSVNKNYLPAFILAAAILVINFFCCYFIKYHQPAYEINILKDIGKLLKNIRIVVFTFWCMYVGVCTALMWNFYLWLVEERAQKMEDSQNWISTLQGILLSTQTLVGELPFFWLSGILLKRIGHVQAMNLVLLVFGIRFLLYSVIENPWYYIPIDICNGLTFGIFYACMTSYACIITPPGAATTIQGLVGALFEGVGVSLGSFIAGYIMKTKTAAVTFRLFGITTLVVCLVHFFVQWLIKEKKPEEDFTARYATPVDALSMLSDDTQEMQLIS